MPVVFRDPSPLTDPRLIAVAERHLGCEVPAGYVELLTTLSNGGPVEPNELAGDETGVSVRAFYGVGRDDEWDLVRAAEEWRSVLPDWFLVVGEDSFGNRIGVSVRQADLGSVWFWDHESLDVAEEAVTRVARDIASFLAGLGPLTVPEPDVVSVWVDPDFKPEFD
ncbi:MAG: SMI1/KNR4 family protein [Actinomycetia bacterium]|nr:SMI1/KNR4 family protein [Actinomycetes bacterium]